MKKIVILLAAVVALSSCGFTTSDQDKQMLQEKYQTVYSVNFSNYVVIDSVGTYHIILTSNGRVRSKIKIK
jgi:outer membrane lipoprotein-sorting protein